MFPVQDKINKEQLNSEEKGIFFFYFIKNIEK